MPDAVPESELFRLVADSAPVLIWMSGLDKLCTYFNKTWLDFTGRSLDRELGNGWAEGVHREDIGRCMNTYTDSFDRRVEFRMEYRIRRHDGEYRWLLDIGVPRFDCDQAFAGYIGIGVDVTDRKHTERALERAGEKLMEREQRLSLALEAGRMYAYDWDVATDRLFRSEEAQRILGYEPPAYRQDIEARVHPDDLQLFKDAVRRTPHKPDVQVTCRFRRPDGSFAWLENTSHAFFDGSGKMVRMVGIIADVTERKLAEQSLATATRRLIEIQENERKRIARELHDNINQRLAVLGAEVQTLKALSENSSPDLARRLDILFDRVSEISDGVQSISHQLHSAQLQYLGIVPAITAFCREFGKQSVAVQFTHENIPEGVPSDISLCLFRIVQEALNNAAKHSHAKEFEVNLRRLENHLHLTVSDRGTGFDAETAMNNGGLGLVSMRERVFLVNGKISIDSQPMQGTTVNVQVPLDQARNGLVSGDTFRSLTNNQSGNR
jgi:PAS domain S-box-containing protein